MPYELKDRLVIGVASSAVFDLRHSDAVFRSQGEEQYRKYQEENLGSPLPKNLFTILFKPCKLHECARRTIQVT
ncbi:5'-nucleotidase [Xanthomonas oryzae]|uniref:5'-nucleotidase n=1 Tax=Xanthomonas oryzae TaxID=347 RepID=UPI000A5310FC